MALAAPPTLNETQPLRGQVVDVDQYSALDHKAIMRSTTWNHLPRWTPVRDRRRLTAYLLLDAYHNNVARAFLSADPKDPDRQDTWQEYGDIGVIVRRIAAAILGEAPGLVIDGADDPIPDVANIRDAPEPPDPEAMTEPEFEIRNMAYQAAVEVWRVEAAQLFAEWRELVRLAPIKRRRQAWLQQWATDDRVIAKMVENERANVVKFGDGIYVMGWDDIRKRPTVEIYDPNAYFPDLGDDLPSVFPDRVNLTYGFFETDEQQRSRPMVRRLTYELVDITEMDRATTFLGAPAGYLANPADQRQVCLLTDGVWKLDDFRRTDLTSIESAGTFKQVTVDGVEVELKRYPLGYDFVPVVHQPHTLATQNHFGESPLLGIAQLSDELAASDTDESLASRWAARPPFTVSGMAQAGGKTEEERRKANQINVRPGFAVKVKEGGGVDVLNLAESLVAIGNRIKDLLKRQSTNIEVPEIVIGRSDASEFASGFALQLSFTPFNQSTQAARLARDGKNELIVKMAQRIQIHHTGGFPNDAGVIEPDIEVYAGRVQFGTFMPRDLAETVQIITRSLETFAMSQETAIRMLQADGVPVDDIANELAAIRARMTEQAKQIREALGDRQVVADFLGIILDTETDVDPDPDPEPAVDPISGPGTPESNGANGPVPAGVGAT